MTAFADNPVGRLIEDLILQGGVDHSHIRWVPYDGIGRTVRNGLNFTERGFGVRGAVGCSDRANTAASQMSAGRRGLGRDLRHGRRALVSHGRDLRGPIRHHPGRRRGGHRRRPAGTGRSSRSTSTTANRCGVPLVGPRRASGSCTSSSRRSMSSSATRRTSSRRSGIDVAGVDASFDRLEAEAYAAMLTAAADALPEPARDRRDAARRPNGQSKRLGGAALVGRCRVTRRPPGATWTSSTGSAAATRSPPA